MESNSIDFVHLIMNVFTFYDEIPLVKWFQSWIFVGWTEWIHDDGGWNQIQLVLFVSLWTFLPSRWDSVDKMTSIFEFCQLNWINR